MQSLYFWAFFSNVLNGCLEDCIITLIDKTDGSDSTKGEKYWRILFIYLFIVTANFTVVLL